MPCVIRAKREDGHRRIYGRGDIKFVFLASEKQKDKLAIEGRNIAAI